MYAAKLLSPLAVAVCGRILVVLFPTACGPGLAKGSFTVGGWGRNCQNKMKMISLKKSSERSYN